MKTCRKCGVRKSRDDFHPAGRAKDKLQVYCKECSAASALASYHTRPLHLQMLASARSRAVKVGVPFDLTPGDLAVPALCPVLGIPLTKGPDGRAHAGSPSVDRIVPERGYVPGNVRVISFRANSIKNDATLAELEAVVAYVRRETGRNPPSF